MRRLGLWLARFLTPVPPLQAARITYYTTGNTEARDA